MGLDFISSNLSLFGNKNPLYRLSCADTVLSRKIISHAIRGQVFESLGSHGRLVKTLMLKGNESAFDVSELKAGMYFVKISSKEGGVAVKKLMIK